jgi:hypothetical protein
MEEVREMMSAVGINDKEQWENELDEMLKVIGVDIKIYGPSVDKKCLYKHLKMISSSEYDFMKRRFLSVFRNLFHF